VSHKGIDVSSHQGKIDWQKVADDGVEFAFIRTALRGYGSGKLVEDEYCDANIKGATDAGIHVGLYIFSQAITEDEVLEEAQQIIDKASEFGVDGPIVIDVEKVSSSTGRMNALSVEERTNLVLLFCQTVENAGYKPMIYHNTEMGALMVDIATLEDYDKWFASYAETMFYPYQYDIWQYSAKGSVDGIKTDVDMNISFTEFWNED
jgi:GH25 family lysozyme M1 (1,4-beta-N-acetylmuramidase)